MDQPLVSVVIPTYNRPEFLRESLGSVLRQSHANLEVIVQDNASTCAVDGLVASFADRRVTLVRNAANIGPAQNYLAGYRRATGKYVAALGDDDRWHPDFLASLVAPLEADPDLVLAFSDHDVIDETGRCDPSATQRTTRRWRRDRLREGTYRPFHDIALVDRAICHSATLWRRGIVDYAAVPPMAGLGLDLYLFYLAARTGRGCYYTPRRLAQYRYQRESLTGDLGASRARRIEMAGDAIFYWGRFLEDPAVPRHKRYFEMKRGYNALLVVADLLLAGRSGDAMHVLARFARDGVITPRIFLYHALYAVRLRRATG